MSKSTRLFVREPAVTGAETGAGQYGSLAGADLYLAVHTARRLNASSIHPLGQLWWEK